MTFIAGPEHFFGFGRAGFRWGLTAIGRTGFHHLGGPLAGALSPGTDVYVGQTSVRQGLSLLQRTVATWRFGGLPLAVLDRSRLADDRMQLRYVDSGEGGRLLTAVRLEGAEGGHAELRWGGGITLEGQPVIEHRLHFANPYLGQDGVTIRYYYDRRSGNLIPLEPTAINQRVVRARRGSELGPRGIDIGGIVSDGGIVTDGTPALYAGTHQILPIVAHNYSRLIGLKQEGDSKHLVTRPANTGMWRGVMANILADPNLLAPGQGLGLALGRTTIEGLSFQRGDGPPLEDWDLADVVVFPVAIRQRRGGEELDVTIELRNRLTREQGQSAQGPFATFATQGTLPSSIIGMRLYVRGNLPHPDIPRGLLYEAPRVRDDHLSGAFNGRTTPLTMMTDPRAFGEISGDSNPYHAEPRVWRLAGLAHPPIHGLAIAGQIEAALMNLYAPSLLGELELTILNPAFPGRTYQLETRRAVGGEKGSYQFQLIGTGSAGGTRKKWGRPHRVVIASGTAREKV